MVLTSSDGTVQKIGPGEAVTIPEKRVGIVEADRYLRVWVLRLEN
jgi:hypothetical protein